LTKTGARRAATAANGAEEAAATAEGTARRAVTTAAVRLPARMRNDIVVFESEREGEARTN